MLSKPDEYMPYLPETSGSVSYNEYCAKVSSTAEWGGQVELTALVNALHVPITVFSHNSPPLVMGSDYDNG